VAAGGGGAVTTGGAGAVTTGGAGAVTGTTWVPSSQAVIKSIPVAAIAIAPQK
jgi:hypothetical protein